MCNRPSINVVCVVSDQNLTEGNQEYAKYFALWMLSTFWGVSAKKLCLYPETVPRLLDQSLRRGKLVKNLKIFWMNEWNNWWIRLSYDVKNYVDLGECFSNLGLKPRWIAFSEICIIVHIIRKPNSTIAKYSMNCGLISVPGWRGWVSALYNMHILIIQIWWDTGAVFVLIFC